MSLLHAGDLVNEKGAYDGTVISRTPKHRSMARSDLLDLIPLLRSRDEDNDSAIDGDLSSSGSYKERRRAVAWVLQLLCAALGGAAVALLLRPSVGPAGSTTESHRHDSVPVYPAVKIPKKQAPHQSKLVQGVDLLAFTQLIIDIWKNIGIEEAVEIREWLMEDKRGLNITRSHEAAER
jgi:hypothetical protein